MRILVALILVLLALVVWSQRTIARQRQEIEHWRQEAIFQVRDGKPVTWREEARVWIKAEAQCEASSH